LRNVEELDLSYVESIDNIIKIIRYMPILKKLNLYGSYIKDNHIKFLLDQKCSSTILDLNISRCSNLTNNCMIYIASLRNLEKLNLSNSCHIIKGGINYLCSHKKLSYLNLSNCCTVNNNLIHVGKIVNLEELDISGIDDININNIMHLLKFTKFTKIHVNFVKNGRIDSDKINITYNNYFTIHFCCKNLNNLKKCISNIPHSNIFN
jgi:hypothetical protein